MASDGGLTRFVIESVTHRNGQQFISGRGLAGERFVDVLRPEPHGFATHPPIGGIATVMQARGNRDMLFAIAGSDLPTGRPELPPGGAALYDHLGNVVKLIGDEAVFDFSNRSATFKAGAWTINGALTIEAGAGGATINGQLTINGDIQLNGNLTATGSVVDGNGDGGA